MQSSSSEPSLSQWNCRRRNSWNSLITWLSQASCAHGYCYLWDPWLVWLNVFSDGSITLSYYCIPVVLVYFIQKRRDLPFNWIFWMFGAFTLAWALLT